MVRECTLQAKPATYTTVSCPILKYAPVNKGHIKRKRVKIILLYTSVCNTCMGACARLVSLLYLLLICLFIISGLNMETQCSSHLSCAGRRRFGYSAEGQLCLRLRLYRLVSCLFVCQPLLIEICDNYPPPPPERLLSTVILHNGQEKV